MITHPHPVPEMVRQDAVLCYPPSSLLLPTVIIISNEDMIDQCRARPRREPRVSVLLAIRPCQGRVCIVAAGERVPRVQERHRPSPPLALRPVPICVCIRIQMGLCFAAVRIEIDIDPGVPVPCQHPVPLFLRRAIQVAEDDNQFIYIFAGGGHEGVELCDDEF